MRNRKSGRIQKDSGPVEVGGYFLLGKPRPEGQGDEGVEKTGSSGKVKTTREGFGIGT